MQTTKRCQWQKDANNKKLRLFKDSKKGGKSTSWKLKKCLGVGSRDHHTWWRSKMNCLNAPSNNTITQICKIFGNKPPGDYSREYGILPTSDDFVRSN